MSVQAELPGASRVIRSDGDNIYARELEDVVMRLLGVADVGIIGVPDAKVPTPSARWRCRAPGRAMTADEVIARWARHLAGYTKAKHVVFAISCRARPRTRCRSHSAGAVRTSGRG